ncbi:hypothetical protein B0H14DRAFT_2666128 [Mycena olivaceomarginata]|nr:hypothetical protein B0H14DRAFT_2666128 [Mycena olivaceomarginata]
MSLDAPDAMDVVPHPPAPAIETPEVPAVPAMELPPPSAPEDTSREDAGLLLQASPTADAAPAPFSDPQNHTPLDRPLNVTDALSYLDAVKNKFHDQPNEFKSQIIDTPGVIKRVSHLFNGHAVLIQGFNTFLPTTNNGPGKGPILWSTTEARTTTSAAPPAPSPTRPPSAEPKQHESQTIEPAVQYVQKIKQRCDAETYRQFLDILSKYHHKPDTIDEEEVSKQIARLFKDDPDLRAEFRIFMPERNHQKRKRKAVEKEIVEIIPKAAPKVRSLSPTFHVQPDGPKGQEGQAHSGARFDAIIPQHPEDSHAHVFFDRVKRYLDDSRETYNEFLKLVNLFTQDFIDTARLIKESRNFLGDSELLNMLREIVGWDERKEKEYWMEEQAAGNSWVRPTIIGRNAGDVQFGSYRKIPASDANVTCSGRDEMCRDVLNDEWVSHPTWSSEDAGFVTPPEEERHEYDFHIEAIVRTITMLEPLNNKMASLSPEDRASYKPKPNLNGAIKSIHHRVIKKIYGREGGAECNPCHAGYAGTGDPRRPSAVEAEGGGMEARAERVEQSVARGHHHQSLCEPDRDSARGADGQTRLEFVMDDTQVLQDALKLTFSFLDRTQGQINFAERKRIEGFLRSFVPLFFMLDPVAFNAAFVVVQETADSELSDDAISSVGSTSSRAGGKNRRNAVKSEQAKSSNRKTRNYGSPSVSRLPSPVPMDEDAQPETPALPQVLYSRLALFKGIAARLASHEKADAPTDPGSFPHPDSVHLGERASTAEHFYDLLLESCERLFDNELEQNLFEDQVRFMFGIKIFTIDKLIGSLIKQVQLLFGDEKSQDLLEVLKREQALASPTTQDLINSRKNAEKILGPDENLFRVDWLPDSKHMTFQLIGKDDSSFDDSEVLTGRWQSYIDSFVSSEATESVSFSRTKRPFLRKNLPAAVQNAPPNVVTQDGLEIKICVRTYRLFYVSASEDYLFKLRTCEDVEAASKQLKKRNVLRQQWLQQIESS